VLIADEDNRRLLLVDPYGWIRWLFPGLGALGTGQVFGPPDDAFVSADGRSIVATQEMDQTISVIDIATGRITRRYGHPGMPGSEPGRHAAGRDAAPRGCCRSSCLDRDPFGRRCTPSHHHDPSHAASAP
jgi:hypothetical protein